MSRKTPELKHGAPEQRFGQNPDKMQLFLHLGWMMTAQAAAVGSPTLSRRRIGSIDPRDGQKVRVLCPRQPSREWPQPGAFCVAFDDARASPLFRYSLSL